MTVSQLPGVTLHDWHHPLSNGKSLDVSGTTDLCSKEYCGRCGVPYDGTNARQVCTGVGADTAQPKAAFNAAVDEVFGAALAISNQRGSEYADSWALENQQTRFLNLVLHEIKREGTPKKTRLNFSPEEKRLIMVASLCDVKMSRMIGGFKGDTLDDLINYVAALRKWLGEYTSRGKQETTEAD